MRNAQASPSRFYRQRQGRWRAQGQHRPTRLRQSGIAAPRRGSPSGL